MTDLDLLEKELKEEIALREEALTEGRVGSWEEYKFLTGVVAGLNGALGAVKHAKKRYEEL